MSRGKILAIDDEHNIRRLIQNELGLEDFDVVTAESGEEGLDKLSGQSFDVVLLDIMLPKMNGMDVLRQIVRETPHPEVIMITGFGDIETAVESMKLGARDYITKPFKLSEIISLIGQITEEQRQDDGGAAARASSAAAVEAGFVLCQSQKMEEIYELVDKVAPTDVTVLIEGETGVGKDVLARQIYVRSRRKNEPYVVVDCGLLTENLAESELYGHCRGAFSGARERKKGLVEEAEGGTIFFDEIGNIELNLQKKFLRYLETKRFRRLGETQERTGDTRILLATNLKLHDAAREGQLRKDLLYRMDVICIKIPPLRQHREDIPTLTEYFLREAQLSDRPMRMSREAMDVLVQYPWPGNIRELKSVLVKSTIFAKTENIQPDDLPSHVTSRTRSTASTPKTLEDLEREHIIKVLEEMGGNQSKAAEILGINRKTLYKKIRKYEIFS